MGKWLNNVARIIKFNKNGKSGYFLKFERRQDKDGNYIGEDPFPIVINEGDILSMKTKSEDLAKLVADGRMSQETADKICESVKFEISIPPRDQDATPAKPTEKKSKVDF